jgi:hypothetical protein
MFLIVAVTVLKKKLELRSKMWQRIDGVSGVPQIWLTYDELAALMDCDTTEARGAAVAIRLDRRKSRDGKTRAKLTPSLTEAFLDRVLARRLEQEVAACAGDLRAMRERMAVRSDAMPKIRAAVG